MGEQGTCFKSVKFCTRRRRWAAKIHTNEVGDISKHPDYQEGHANAIGAFGLVIDIQLRELRQVSSVLHYDCSGTEVNIQ